MEKGNFNTQARITMLLAWHDRATRANLVHYFQAEECRKLNNFLTIFNLLAAISVLFLANNPLLKLFGSSSILLLIATLAVVLTTALHYVLKLDERTYDHKAAGNEFTAIKRKIERMLVDKSITENNMLEIESDHNHTSKNHNLVRQAIWRKIRTRYGEACEENKKFFESLHHRDTTSKNG